MIIQKILFLYYNQWWCELNKKKTIKIKVINEKKKKKLKKKKKKKKKKKVFSKLIKKIFKLN